MYFPNGVQVTAADVFGALNKVREINKEQTLGMQMSWSPELQLQLYVFDETIRLVENEQVKFLDGTIDPDYTDMLDAYNRWFGFVGATLVVRLSETTWEVNAWYHD